DVMSSTIIPEVYLNVLKRGIYVKKKLDYLVKKGLEMLAELVNAKYLIFNPASWETSIYIKTNKEVDGYFQELSDGKKLVYVKNLPPLGYRAFSKFKDKPNDKVNLKDCKNTILIENKYLTVYISKKLVGS
ncbi:MAG: alpha-mannosidase, partial [Candidatus Odinarchaeota archaeon]|nr:alpha-mannosidase [Candidatus Odinarchaeota archaeon]